MYREHEIALPDELTEEQQLDLVGEMIKTMIGEKPYQYAVHANTSTLEGDRNPHLHLMYSDRTPAGIERTPQKTFSRFNAKHPELGGYKKDSGGKNALEMRIELIELRRKCAELQNISLEKHGHAARVDHRTLKLQGIAREPERHLGQARVKIMNTEERVQYVKGRRNQE